MTSKPKPRPALDRDLLTKLWNNETPIRDMQVILGVGHDTISRRVKEWGLTPRQPGGNRRKFETLPKTDRTARDSNNRIPFDKDELISMWDEGMTRKAIGQHFGASEATITRWTVDLGLEPRMPGQRPDQPRPARPVIDKPAPVYHQGMMADLKRAKGSAIAIGRLHAKYKVPLAELYKMAGVAV